MYLVLDGLTMPDVHNGYFIDTAARVVDAATRGLPTRIAGDPQRDVQVFGSDGGGGLFALSTGGEVIYLQSDGVVDGGVFRESENVRARRIAVSVSEFLDLLLCDVRAFVTEKEHHRYLID
jgi:hypothetical protein